MPFVGERNNNLGYAVQAQRREPPDSLDFFPTPPWATRALLQRVLQCSRVLYRHESAWEPACGEGHMAEVLKEYFGSVTASDVFDYGQGKGQVYDFLDPELVEYRHDWIITNP